MVKLGLEMGIFNNFFGGGKYKFYEFGGYRINYF